jgi:2-amino-4-hydroxy-6-hydroxymethyldihydropteridine diphosphokinase
MLSEVYIGLGSNLGNPPANIAEGLRLLRQEAVSLEASSLYRTGPQGFQSQPTFYNAACHIWTRLDPFQLLARVKEIEAAIGRRRTFQNAPRTLDIDILIYSRLVLETPLLKLPHPRMAERAFVLLPLAEVGPRISHPVLGKTPHELLAVLPQQRDTILRLPLPV